MSRDRMRVGELKLLLQAQRAEALATRDPLAIRYAHSRWMALNQIVQGLPDDEIIDLSTATVGVKVAAEVLGYTPQQVRKLIRERRLPASKQGEQWRIPIRILL